jgi:hypothetical protein
MMPPSSNGRPPLSSSVTRTQADSRLGRDLLTSNNDYSNNIDV